MTTLLKGIVRGVPEGAEPRALDADEPNPIGALKARTLRALHRDLARLGFDRATAERIVSMVMTALKQVFDAPGVSLDDRTAACVVAERVTMATLFGLSQGVLRRSPEKTD
jgi:hypothetical protein